jgi:peptide/nickel transport system permease protein
VLTFILRRLLIALPLLFLASILVFALVVNAGDPLAGLRERPNSQAQVARLTEELNLDKPLLQRYGIWLKGAVHGDFGVDTKGRAVEPKVYDALKTTMRMVLIAFLVAITLGVGVGVFSALRQYSKFDYTFTFVAFLFFAMPVFWFAVLLKEYGAVKLNNVLEGWGYSRWISTIGPATPGFEGSFMARVGDNLGHLILPTITLAVISFAAYSRYQRASMLETLKSDYVRTARAKGISEKRVVYRHAFRTALIPIATLVALDFGVLLGGAIITENIFAWRGMGTLLRESVLRDIDPNTAMAVLMIIAFTVVLFNLIADIVYAYLDPRIRLE